MENDDNYNFSDEDGKQKNYTPAIGH